MHQARAVSLDDLTSPNPIMERAVGPTPDRSADQAEAEPVPQLCGNDRHPNGRRRRLGGSVAGPCRAIGRDRPKGGAAHKHFFLLPQEEGACAIHAHARSELEYSAACLRWGCLDAIELAGVLQESLSTSQSGPMGPRGRVAATSFFVDAEAFCGSAYVEYFADRARDPTPRRTSTFRVFGFVRGRGKGLWTAPRGAWLKHC